LGGKTIAGEKKRGKERFPRKELGWGGGEGEGLGVSNPRLFNGGGGGENQTFEGKENMAWVATSGLSRDKKTKTKTKQDP